LGAAPDRVEPEALITILEAGCETAPAKYPMAIAADPCRVDPAPVPKETALMPPYGYDMDIYRRFRKKPIEKSSHTICRKNAY